MGNGACVDGHGCGRGCGHDRGCGTWSGSSSCRGRDLCRQIGRHVRLRRGRRCRRGSARLTSLRGHGSGRIMNSVSNRREEMVFAKPLTPQTLVPSRPRTASSASLVSSNSTKAKPGGFLATQTFFNGPYFPKQSSSSYLLALLPRFPMYTLQLMSQSRCRDDMVASFQCLKL